ncbi:hypothetical protein V8F06_003171 [Rhypophila decipiens]
MKPLGELVCSWLFMGSIKRCTIWNSRCCVHYKSNSTWSPAQVLRKDSAQPLGLVLAAAKFGFRCPGGDGCAPSADLHVFPEPGLGIKTWWHLNHRLRDPYFVPKAAFEAFSGFQALTYHYIGISVSLSDLSLRLSLPNQEKFRRLITPVGDKSFDPSQPLSWKRRGSSPVLLGNYPPRNRQGQPLHRAASLAPARDEGRTSL